MCPLLQVHELGCPLPACEADRLATMQSLGLLDSGQEIQPEPEVRRSVCPAGSGSGSSVEHTAPAGMLVPEVWGLGCTALAPQHMGLGFRMRMSTVPSYGDAAYDRHPGKGMCHEPSTIVCSSHSARHSRVNPRPLRRFQLEAIHGAVSNAVVCNVCLLLILPLMPPLPLSFDDSWTRLSALP